MPFLRFNEKKQSDSSRYIVSISTWTVLKIIFIVLGLAFAWFIRSVIGILFVSWVFASALDPFVDRLARYRIPRAVTILTVLLLSVLVFALGIYLVIPPLTEQIGQIALSLRDEAPLLERAYQSITGASDGAVVSQLQQNLTSFNSTLSNLTRGIITAAGSVFGGLAAVLIMLVITFYMTVDEDGMKKFVRSIAPIQYQPYLVQKVNRIQEKMGSWFRGQLILMLIIGVFSFIGLASLRVPYALVLAFLSGILEFVPYIGPVLAAVPAIFFAYTDSPSKAIGVIIFYTVLQQLENQVIVPKVMQKAVGLNPIVVLTVMMIGAQIAGLVGIILAVPAATILWIFLEDVYLHKQAEENKLEGR